MKHIKRYEPQRTQRNNFVEKEKDTENTEKKNKNSVLSVLKKSYGCRGGLCVFYSFCFLIFNYLISNGDKISSLNDKFLNMLNIYKGGFL